MEHKMVTIPFDLETAKKIRKGERLGQAVSTTRGTCTSSLATRAATASTAVAGFGR